MVKGDPCNSCTINHKCDYYIQKLKSEIHIHPVLPPKYIVSSSPFVLTLNHPSVTLSCLLIRFVTFLLFLFNPLSTLQLESSFNQNLLLLLKWLHIPFKIKSNIFCQDFNDVHLWNLMFSYSPKSCGTLHGTLVTLPFLLVIFILKNYSINKAFFKYTI